MVGSSLSRAARRAGPRYSPQPTALAAAALDALGHHAPLLRPVRLDQGLEQRVLLFSRRGGIFLEGVLVRVKRVLREGGFLPRLLRPVSRRRRYPRARWLTCGVHAPFLRSSSHSEDDGMAARGRAGGSTATAVCGARALSKTWVMGGRGRLSVRASVLSNTGGSRSCQYLYVSVLSEEE